jgi:hypothetical protein
MSGGGKAVPVKEEERQQRLNFVAAENPRQRRSESRRDGDRSTLRLRKERKAKGKPKKVGLVRMGEVVERLEEAFEIVATNRGSPGPDRQSIEYVREHLQELMPELRAGLVPPSFIALKSAIRRPDYRKELGPLGGKAWGYLKSAINKQSAY